MSSSLSTIRTNLSFVDDSAGLYMFLGLGGYIVSGHV